MGNIKLDFVKLNTWIYNAYITFWLGYIKKNLRQQWSVDLQFKNRKNERFNI